MIKQFFLSLKRKEQAIRFLLSAKVSYLRPVGHPSQHCSQINVPKFPTIPGKFVHGPPLCPKTSDRVLFTYLDLQGKCENQYSPLWFFLSPFALSHKINKTNQKNGPSLLFSPLPMKKKKGKREQAPMGFEPMTSCLLDRRSNQLSYGALHTSNLLFASDLIRYYPWN